MERINQKSSSDYKNKPVLKHSDCDSRPGPSNGSSNQWQDKVVREQRRGQGIKREHTPDAEFSKDSTLQGRNKMIKEESNVNSEEQQPNISPQEHFKAPHQQQLQSVSQQPQMQTLTPSFPAYGYGVPDHFNMDPSQRSYPMMAPYNMYASMNSQWPGNQVDAMCMPPNGMQVNAAALPVSSGMEMTPSANTGMNPYAAFMPIAGDMYSMMGGMGNFCPFPMFPQESMMVAPVKETITLSSCVLYPPHPGQHIKTREKHPGCKTVFVGGLPENITEEIIREIFQRCGDIATVRMSKKNFCHVRFAAMAYVDEAMTLSGYRLKIENKDDSAYAGRLHVDYAKARDDEYEYECLQRAMQREARHRERLEQEASRPPTPPPVVHYSEHEANLLSDKLKSEENFKMAIHVLITWLDRGECNRKTCGNFYSMIQCTNCHVKRLINEKGKFEEELNKATSQLQQKMTGISLQFNEIHKLFEIVKLQKVWDHFSKPQKKNIDSWRQQTLEIIKAHSKELVEERVEDEMDLSDGEGETEKSPDSSLDYQKGVSKEDVQKLKVEMDNVRNQLQTAIEENASIRNEKDSNSSIYTKVFQEMQENFMAKQSELAELHQYKENYLAMQAQREVPEVSKVHKSYSDRSQQTGNNLSITQHESRLVALIATFLNVHPFGASIDYICSYLIKIDPKVNARDIESLLQRFPNLFSEQSSGIGATLVKNWKFLGFSFKSD